MTDILIPLVAVGLAELGDKTQLSILLLSSKTKNHLQLLLGVTLAFLIVDGFAVLACSWTTNIIPVSFLKISAGIIFIIYGVLILKGNEVKDDGKLYSRNPFLSGFVLILITEWGDKTQVASGLCAIKYNALMVLTGTMIALTLLSIMAIYLGKFVSNKVNKKTMTKIAGIVFILIGISSFLL